MRCFGSVWRCKQQERKVRNFCLFPRRFSEHRSDLCREAFMASRDAMARLVANTVDEEEKKNNQEILDELQQVIVSRLVLFLVWFICLWCCRK